MSHNDILLDVHNGIGKITINRPEVLNAFTPVTLKEMISAVDDFREDDRVGVLVLTGSGDRSFCAGGDVKWETTEEFREDAGIVLTHRLYAAIRRCLKPIIARVNGYAIGGGNHLAYMCDFTIASDNAQFGQNGARVASPAEGWLVSYLATVVGMKRAKEMWIMCRRYSARQMMEWGLVNSVVSLEELDDEVKRWCDEILSLSPTVVKLLKRSFDDSFASIREQQDRFSLRELIAPGFFESGEQEEGARAFLEKRSPDFSPWR